jgi:hypothetical protein
MENSMDNTTMPETFDDKLKTMRERRAHLTTEIDQQRASVKKADAAFADCVTRGGTSEDFGEVRGQKARASEVLEALEQASPLLDQQIKELEASSSQNKAECLAAQHSALLREWGELLDSADALIVQTFRENFSGVLAKIDELELQANETENQLAKIKPRASMRYKTDSPARYANAADRGALVLRALKRMSEGEAFSVAFGGLQGGGVPIDEAAYQKALRERGPIDRGPGAGIASLRVTAHQ